MRVVTERIPQRFGLHPMRAMQVLTPMNRGILAHERSMLCSSRPQSEATPRVTRFGWTYAPGDTVIQTVNNDENDVSKGDMGQVAEVDPDAGQVAIDCDSRSVTYDVGERDAVALAYATTVHTSQGPRILSW